LKSSTYTTRKTVSSSWKKHDRHASTSSEPNLLQVRLAVALPIPARVRGDRATPAPGGIPGSLDALPVLWPFVRQAHPTWGRRPTWTACTPAQHQRARQRGPGTFPLAVSRLCDPSMERGCCSAPGTWPHPSLSRTSVAPEHHPALILPSRVVLVQLRVLLHADCENNPDGALSCRCLPRLCPRD
jgi:hypothetical protein